jgi:hypothetical protein
MWRKKNKPEDIVCRCVKEIVHFFTKAKKFICRNLSLPYGENENKLKWNSLPREDNIEKQADLACQDPRKFQY